MVLLSPKRSNMTGLRLKFPYRDGDGGMDELLVTLFRRSDDKPPAERDLVVILDGDEFVRKTRLLRLMDIGHDSRLRSVDALAVPPGYGHRCRNEKYFGAGDLFDTTIDEVTDIIHHVVDRFYDGGLNTLMVVGNSLTGRASLDLTANLVKSNPDGARFRKVKVAAVAPSFWQFYPGPLEHHLRFMLSRWWLNNHEGDIEREVARRSALVRVRNRALIQDLTHLRSAFKYLMISYTELMRFSGDYPGDNLEEIIAKIRDTEHPVFPNLRKFLRLFVPDACMDEWVGYIRWRLKEFSSEDKRIHPRHYDVYRPHPNVCHIIYEDGHTWSRWAHLFKEIVDPENRYVPNIFDDIGDPT